MANKVWINIELKCGHVKSVANGSQYMSSNAITYCGPCGRDQKVSKILR